MLSCETGYLMRTCSHALTITSGNAVTVRNSSQAFWIRWLANVSRQFNFCRIMQARACLKIIVQYRTSRQRQAMLHANNAPTRILAPRLYVLQT